MASLARPEEPRAEPVAAVPLRERFGPTWRAAVIVSLLLVGLLLYALRGPALVGIGVWGNNIPFVWGFDLTNYAWWIGIANGVSLFAVLLVLRRHSLRTEINRFAEALALAAAICASIFPLFHLGRPWLAYWMVPYPAHTGLWPQSRSPLVWDFWSIVSHVLVMGLFWYVGLLPDLATMRDRARSRRAQRIYGVVALGWRGSAMQWAAQQRAHRLIALAVIPFLFVMQSIVALEFSFTIVPEWHQTRLPLHFVAAGFASGLAVALAAAVGLRELVGLKPHVEESDLDLLARLLLAAALVTALLFASEAFYLLLGPPVDHAAFLARIAGPGAPIYWAGVALTVGVPQLLWWRRLRVRPVPAVLIGAAVAVGVWVQYYSVVVTGLARDHLLVTPDLYSPTLSEALLLAGTVGLFALLALLLVRTIPLISLYELRETRGGEP